jgi:D-3-phosphoglycerate dehydrogenase
MVYRLLVTDTVDAGGLNFLREKGYDLKFLGAKDEDNIIKEISDCDGVLVRGEVLSRRVFQNAPMLKVVQKHGTGVDNIDLEAAKDCGVHVMNTPLANIVSVAEHTMMLLLNCAKKINVMREATRNRDYEIRNKVFTDELAGKTLSLIGFGNVGSAVAKIAALGFDMKIIVFDPFAKPEKIPSYVELSEERDLVFKTGDFVSLHLPDIVSTHKTVGMKEFRLMKTSAFFINAARGGIVDEEALIEALRLNEIAGAGLDVLVKEPPDENSPLLKMSDKVIMTPHNAAASSDAMVRMCMHAAQNIHTFFTGEDYKWV